MAANDIKALIVFVDIRGFTVWSDKVSNAAILDDFVKQWYEILAGNFSNGICIKHHGDGAMIVQEMAGKTTAVLLRKHLAETLKRICKATDEFARLCRRLSEEEGTKIDLRLGWGIAKGPVKKINGDYVSADVNKCARYCDIARPFGIVIDADDFQSRPKVGALEFSRQTRLLKGIQEDCDVWVTKEIAEQFIPREGLRENPEVHVAGVCFKKERGKYFILLGQRAKNRKLYPLLYEGCGGQLAHNELFHEGVARHYEKEYHIEVSVHKDIFLLYEINTNNEPKIPGIRFLCEYLAGTPSSSNHVPPTPKWFSEGELAKLPDKQFIPGLKDEIAILLKRYKEKKIETA